MELFNFPINSFSPIDEQVFIQLRNIIANNSLKDQPILPTPRELAIQLKQSQTDIFNAYKQLEIEGFIERNDDEYHILTIDETKSLSAGYMSDFVQTTKTLPYDFAVNLVDMEHFPLKEWQECLMEATTDASVFTASDDNGEMLLKEALQEHLKTNRNMDVSTSNIFVNSSMQALLIRLGVFLRDNGYYNSYISEQPGNQILYNLFKFLHYSTSHYPVTSAGYQIEKIPEQKTLLYASPSQQQPFGITMPIEQRLRLIAWAERNDSLIIEDDTEAEFRYNGRSVSPLASQNSEYLIYIGSFAQSFLPSLRIAYLVLPDRFVKEFTEAVSKSEQNASGFTQLAMAKFMNKGYFTKHLEKMTAIYEQKMGVILTKIQTTLPATVKVYSANVGQFLLLQPNNGMTEDELIASAEQVGVAVYRGSKFSIEHIAPPAPIVQLGFGKLTRKDYISGIERLYQAWFTKD